MLNIEKMIDSAQEALGWPYVSPGSNDKNGIDCSGLFVKIYQDQGAKIAHGSNTIYRQYCTDDKGPIIQPSQLKPGMAIFKHKDQDTEKYPDGLGDFCHIGLVISGNPLRIIHASSEAGCVTTDTKLGKWKYYGKLKDVDYSESAPDDPDEEPYEALCFATVYSDNRKSVKLRAKPSTSCKLYDYIPFGSIVEITKQDISGDGEKWCQVNYKSRTGWYMMSKFLLIDESSVPNVGGSDDFVETPPTSGVTIKIAGISMEDAMELAAKYPQAEIYAG